jgi:hypothetical protein
VHFFCYDFVKKFFNKMLQKKSNPQEFDKTFPNPPTDGISSISINGSSQAQTNMLISTCWDNTVDF